MNYSKINNTSFQGIKLSKGDSLYAYNLKQALGFVGMKVVGKKTYKIQDGIEAKIKTMNYVRNSYSFMDNECGFIFLQNQNETYILANHLTEQHLIKIVRKYDKNAIINLLL